MKSRGNFNTIAPFYDWLCTFVFGQTVKNAQVESLKFIIPNSTILIIGGGTGWILEEIAKIYPSGLNITYLDKSSKMIAFSQERNAAFNKVEFINAAFENIHLSHQKYDIVITPFFLDCFAQDTFQAVFNKLDDSLKINGLWINIDFYLSTESVFWQRILVKLMYTFFRFLCNIEANQLPLIDAYFKSYTEVSKKMYCSNFISAQVFKKTVLQ